MATSSHRPINILSIDGGFVGLPALYLLEEMFSRLKHDLKSDEELRPSEYFDIIGGSGSGALIALLLGRLHMKVSNAIQGYMKLAPILSRSSTDDGEERKANNAAFEQAFCEILVDAGIDANAPLIDKDSPKTLVFTLNSASMTTPYILRSYQSRNSGAATCGILQAACASIASPDNFTAITIGEAHRKVKLVDATMGYANPLSELLREVKEAFNEEVKVATIVSIGAEMKTISTSIDSREAEILQRVNADCERIHEEVQTRLSKSGVYHRFRIESKHGASHEDVFGLASAYLHQGVVGSAVDAVIKSIHCRVAGPSIQDITSVTPVEITLKPRPSLVQTFVGRKDILQAMHHTHSNNRPTDASAPAITVLTGLGGSGKTQIALKFAFEYEDQYPDAPVFFVDGSAETTLKTDLETVIRSQGPNHRSASYEDALTWLAIKSKGWLLIIDNVDNPSIKLSSFIPRCSHGHIIITTRDATRKILAPKSTYAVEGLSASDSVTLLLEASGYEFNPTNQTRAKEIVDELGHLPLALAHSAAYISIHQCLSTFLSTYRQSRAHVLENSPDLVHDYPRSVAATIQMSLNQLSSSARDLLRIFAHLDARSIAYAILAKAAEQSFHHVEWTYDEELEPETVYQAKILMKIFCPSQEWVPVTFDDIISTCLRYSLLRVANQNEDRFYSMHVLVQNYLKDNAGSMQGHTFPRLVTRLLGSAITTNSHYYDHFAFNRLLFPHIRLIGMENVIEAGDHYGFGDVLDEMDDGIVAITHLERCMEQWKQLRGDDDLATLAVMARLGTCYANSGRDEKALDIREQLLAISRGFLGDEDLHTLGDMNNLANSYSAVGREQEALELREIVLEKRRRLLGEDDRTTLDSMNNLAISYSVVGREQEALELKEIVLEKSKRLLGDEHRDTLDSMNNLAISYSVVGREQEALELREVVLKERKRLFGNEHRDTLLAMGNLASSYSVTGREQEALPMQQLVFAKFTTTLGKEHIHTLLYMCHLVQTYQKLGMVAELEELRCAALPLHRRVINTAHEHTKPLHQGDVWAMLRAVNGTDTETTVDDAPTSKTVPSLESQSNGKRKCTSYDLRGTSKRKK